MKNIVHCCHFKEKIEIEHPTFLENKFSLNALDLRYTFHHPLDNKSLIYLSLGLTEHVLYESTMPSTAVVVGAGKRQKHSCFFKHSLLLTLSFQARKGKKA